MTERYVHALWCDDIRQEIGNKPSFMGVYAGGLTVPSLPTILPRLSVYVWAITTIDHPFKKAVLRITRDDGFLLAQLHADNIERNNLQHPKPEEITNIQLMFGINLNGIEIPENSKYFSISIETESETLEGQKLWVSVDPSLFAIPNE